VPSSLLRLVVVIALAGVVLAASTVVVAPQIGAFLTAGDVEAPTVDLDPLAQRSVAFADDGSVLASFHAEENRQELALEEIPVPVRATILAVEDEDFYSHNGVNLRSTLRALAENVSAGGVEQGGSTITQQLVKNSLLTPEQDLNRKVQEAILAIELEKVLTKNEILERYLNQIYFGGGAYGVQAAAELYWGVDAADLDWGQSALLASLIQNPVGYDPVDDPDTAREQRGIALDLLVDVGHLTREEAVYYDIAPLPEARQEVLPEPNDYFIEVVKQQLLSMEELGETQAERYNAVFKGGLKVSTTFVPTAQFFALAARDENLPDTGGQFTSAMASVESGTGAVRALVGGPGFDNYKYDLATQGERQPGSSFKIFTLVEALEQGYVPDDIIDGSSPCRFPNPGGVPDPYVAENFGGSRGGKGTIRQLTTSSSNCGFLRLAGIIGRDKVVERAKAMGITSQIDDVPAMPIGTEEVSPLDMATAASVLANGGVRNDPYFIERIEDSDGEVLYQHQPDPRRVVSERSACLATQILEANVQGGTGTAAGLSGMAAAGKTGTSENFEDAWFVGYTPYLASAVWMGNPAEKIPMTGVGGISVTGGSYPARIWRDFNQPAHTLSPYEAFPSCSAPRRGQDFTRFFTDEPDDEPDDEITDPSQAVCPPGAVPADLDQDGTIESCLVFEDQPAAPVTAPPAPAPSVPPAPPVPGSVP
jgi:penicillin-binding protein 1A